MPGSQITPCHANISRAVLTDLDRPLLARRQPQEFWLQEIHKTSGIIDLLHFQLLLNLPLELTGIIRFRFQNVQSYAGLLAFFTLNNLRMQTPEPIYARRRSLLEKKKKKPQNDLCLGYYLSLTNGNKPLRRTGVLFLLLLVQLLWGISSLVPQLSEVHLNHKVCQHDHCIWISDKNFVFSEGNTLTFTKQHKGTAST